MSNQATRIFKKLAFFFGSREVFDHFEGRKNLNHPGLAFQVQSLRAALGELTEDASQYTTDACLRRYLRARNWSVKRAEKMLRETLEWRATYKPEKIRWVSTTFSTSPSIISSFNCRYLKLCKFGKTLAVTALIAYILVKEMNQRDD